MKIAVHHLAHDGQQQQIDAPLAAGCLAERLGAGAEYRPVADGQMRLQLDCRRRAVQLRGEAQMAFAASCARCLQPLHTEVKVPVRHRLLLAAAGTPRRPPPAQQGQAAQDPQQVEDELEPPTRQLEGEELDLAELVGEDLLLALPMLALCGPNCQGLCPTCGGNRNERGCTCGPQQSGDLRLSALAKIRPMTQNQRR